MTRPAHAVDALLRQLAAWSPADSREADSVEETCAGLRDLARPFDEQAQLTHVTGSALIIGARGVVLLKHKRLGIWLQPGGHIDEGELPHEAALREAVEETGIAVEHLQDPPLLLHVDVHDGGRGHRHLDLRYVFTSGAQDPDPPPDESQECRWFSWDEAARIADPGLRGALPGLREVAERSLE